ncbi:chloride channel protein, partial [Streptomyces clavuligerus]
GTNGPGAPGGEPAADAGGPGGAGTDGTTGAAGAYGRAAGSGAAGSGTGSAAGAAGSGTEVPGTPALRDVLRSPAYLRLLGLSVLVGVPIALACFLFVSLQHAFQHGVWETLPHALGHDRAPWWWPLPALLLAGLLLAPIVTRVPGGGGHTPVHGLGGAPLGPRELPGVVVAALATLPLGVVLGPEAPLMALGSGLALLFVRESRRAAQPRAAMVLATSGSTAAISTILGGPLVAAVMMVEAAGLAGPHLLVLLLPCLLASGVGALVFTGFGSWTGFSIGALELPTVPPDMTPDAGDFLWGVPAAVLIGVVVTAAHRLGYVSEAWTARNTAVRTVLAACAVGALLTLYALLTGRSPEEAALSGQITIGVIAADPGAWPVAALLTLVVCKGLAWGICLGALRGGPIFPAVLLGTALGIACAGLPGFGATPALAVGMTTATAVVTRLPVTSSVLAALLLGPDAANQMPLIAVCAVVGFVVAQLLERREDAKGGQGAGH